MRCRVDDARCVRYRSSIKNQGSNLSTLQSAPLAISSVEDGVHRALRQEIASLRLAPNERLRLEELADRFQVSLTPVRHALRRLESEGLVVSVRRRGSRVAPLSIEELEEVQALRLGLETFLARYGAEACTEEALVEMADSRARMEQAFSDADLDAYIRSFWELRDACYHCADRPRLLRALEDQRVRVERYVLFLCRDPEAFADLRRGPDHLLEACRARDGAAAELATRDALLFVLAELQRMLAAADASEISA